VLCEETRENESFERGRAPPLFWRARACWRGEQQNDGEDGEDAGGSSGGGLLNSPNCLSLLIISSLAYAPPPLSILLIFTFN
jgi:hypothetical protein